MDVSAFEIDEMQMERLRESARTAFGLVLTGAVVVRLVRAGQMSMQEVTGLIASTVKIAKSHPIPNPDMADLVAAGHMEAFLDPGYTEAVGDAVRTRAHAVVDDEAAQLLRLIKVLIEASEQTKDM